MDDPTQRIRAARAYARFSQPAMARVLEMSEKTYKLIELGRRPAKRAELLAIADACSVPMWFLEHGWGGWRGSIKAAEERAALEEASGKARRAS